MKTLAQILASLPNTTTTNQSPEAVQFDCPNCWGTQEWKGIERPAVEVLSKDTTLIGRAREGFIQRFAKRYLTQRSL